MRALVTGATGFVGSRLVPTLVATGHEVRALVRSDYYDPPEGVSVLQGDLLEPGSFEAAFDGPRWPPPTSRSWCSGASVAASGRANGSRSWPAGAPAMTSSTPRRPALRRIDRRTGAFAAPPLPVVPLLRAHPLLAGAVVGHVLAVFAVACASLWLLRRS